MHHQTKKGFRGIFIGITQHQKGNLVYVPHKQRILYLYYVVYDESFSSALAYMSQLYAEPMTIRLAVSYILYAKSSRKTGDRITLSHFEEGNLLSETCNNTERGHEFDDDSTLAPLTNKEKMNAMSSGNEYDAGPIFTDMLEDICDGSKSHPRINRREAGYKIHYHLKQRQA